MRKSASFAVFAARWVLFGSLFAAPRLAWAQPAHRDKIQNEVFDDDLLTADLGTPFGVRVFPNRLPPARTLLIHPRTNFLPELYQSVERL